MTLRKMAMSISVGYLLLCWPNLSRYVAAIWGLC